MKILEVGKEEEVKKGAHLLRQDERCKDLFYVVEGILRVYYIKEGLEITDWFGTAGTIITAMDSFYNQKLSDQNIQAVTKTKVVRVPKKKLVEAISQSDELKDEYLKIVTDHLLRVQQRIKALQFHTAKERYELLTKKNPEVVKYAQRNQIASYLGISLETLSRVTKPSII